MHSRYLFESVRYAPNDDPKFSYQLRGFDYLSNQVETFYMDREQAQDLVRSLKLLLESHGKD